MSELVVLHKPPTENGPNVNDYLEKFIEHVKRGGVENFALVIHNTDQTIMTCWANSNYPYTMIGALDVLKKEFIDRAIEQHG